MSYQSDVHCLHFIVQFKESSNISHVMLNIELELKFKMLISQFTSEEVCPGLPTPGWSWGLLTGTVRRGAGLPRTTVLGVGEVEETGAEASWGS